MVKTFIFLLSFCFSLMALSQEGKMSYIETNKNIGDVTFFENHIITFNYINNTKETLVFKPFKAELDVDVHFQKTIVAPGESDFFVVKYFSENIGAFTKKFTVYTTNNVGVELSINGVIKSFSKENFFQKLATLLFFNRKSRIGRNVCGTRLRLCVFFVLLR